jgi:hypothetical protein
MSKRAWENVVDKIIGGGSDAWKKLGKPTVGRGKTQWPKKTSEQESQGVRFDYDGETTEGGQKYHKWQVQPNAGKIPSSWKEWRDRNGGTHAVIGTVKVKDNASKQEVKEALDTLEDF